MSSSSRTIVLKSSDGENFELNEAEARLSLVIKRIIEADSAKTYIPLPDVTGNILSRIVYYCRKHANAAGNYNALKSEFSGMDDADLFPLTFAAQSLEIKSLVDLTYEIHDDRIKDLSTEEIRKQFNIQNKFLPGI